MKIREIIREYGELSEVKLTQKIKDDCKPYLSIVGLTAHTRHALYRGLRGPNVRYLHQPNPVNRKPKDTPPENHNIIDDWFLDQFKIRYRSNAIFATGSYRYAEFNFGQVYELFPIGDFKFCWSPNIEDLTFDLVDSNAHRIITMPGSSTRDDKLKEVFSSLLSKAEYQSTDLIEAIESEKEIMIHAPQGGHLIEQRYAQQLFGLPFNLY